MINKKACLTIILIALLFSMLGYQYSTHIMSILGFNGSIYDRLLISRISGLETWNATYINDTNTSGAFLNGTMRGGQFQIPNDHSEWFFAPGGYGGDFGLGAAQLPLEVDNDEQYGMLINESGCNAWTQYKGRIYDTAVISRVHCNQSTEGFNSTGTTQFTQYNRGFTFNFDNLSKYIQIESGRDNITGQVGGLNMNGNYIYNSPDISKIWTTGVISGANLTFDNTTGNITISSGVAMIRSGNSSDYPLFSTIFVEKNFSIVYGQTKYIYLEYQSGLPAALQETTSISDIGGFAQIQVYQVFLNNVLHVIDARGQNVESGYKTRNLFYDTERFRHASGGMIGSPSNLNISVTAGKYYYGINPILHSAIDTSQGATFQYYYHNATTWFSYVANHLNNTFYNNPTGLTALLPNHYKTEWIYVQLSYDNNDEMIVLFGNASYTSQADAEAEAIPSNVPVEVRDIAVLVGRVIIKEGVSTPVKIESVFITQFSPSGVYDHNLLANLQGGIVNEYYHLNLSQYTSISTFAKNTTLIDYNNLKVNKTGDTMSGVLNLPQLNVSSRGLLFLEGGGSVDYSNNLFWNNGNWYYHTTAPGSLIQVGAGGDVSVFTAPSGTIGTLATISQKFYVQNDGKINMNTLSASAQSNALCYNSGSGLVTYNSGLTTCLASTETSKTNITNITTNYNQSFMNIKPINYTSKLDGRQNYGFSAQQIEKVYPELVGYDNQGNISGVKYENMVAVLTKVIQEQQIMINRICAKNQTLCK